MQGEKGNIAQAECAQRGKEPLERMLPSSWRYLLVAALSSSLVLGKAPPATTPEASAAGDLTKGMLAQLIQGPPPTTPGASAAGDVADGMMAQLMDSACDKAIAAFGIESRKAQAPCRCDTSPCANNVPTRSDRQRSLIGPGPCPRVAPRSDSDYRCRVCVVRRAARTIVKPRRPRLRKRRPRTPLPLIGLRLARSAAFQTLHARE